MRFCAYQYQHRTLSVLAERWRRAEAMGFDVLWNVDTVNEPDQPRTPMFEGSTTLAAMALLTSSIRIGTLVTSLYFRNPVIAAKAAMTVDQLSGGRVEVALGAGDPSARPEALASCPALRVSKSPGFASSRGSSTGCSGARPPRSKAATTDVEMRR
jgi:alkanesulfonate monooxygenase SsuD/methylene tetrahydromethanopterin reductase-like flavin-dependent oxidoreductase (luciferase family)